MTWSPGPDAGTLLVRVICTYSSLTKGSRELMWLVGCLGFNGPFRQYFSVYRAVSQRDRKKRKDRRQKKCPNNPHLHLLQAQLALVLLLSKLVGRPSLDSLPSTFAPPDHTSVGHVTRTDSTMGSRLSNFLLCYKSFLII